MTRSLSIWLVVMVTAVALGCGESDVEEAPPRVADTVLDELPSGNPSLGREAFLRLHCNDCHEVIHDPSLPPPQQFPDARIGPAIGSGDRESIVGAVLSGVHFPRNDQPDSARWPPEMGDLSTRMTVAELIDISSYLTETPATSREGEGTD